jgi:hypothetical protein
LWPSDDLPTPLRPPVDTGAGDRGDPQTKGPRPQISHLSVKSHSGIAPDPSFQPRVDSPVSPTMDAYPRGLVDTWAPNTPPC